MKTTARKRAAVTKSFRHSGLPIRDIAERHGVPVGTVWYWTRGLVRVVPRRRRPEAILDRAQCAAAMAEYDAGGVSYAALGRKFGGVSAPVMFRSIHAAGTT